MKEMINKVLDPHKYRCIRCKAPADVIYKLLPFCTPHEPAESRAARQPKEGEMDHTSKPVHVDPTVVGNTTHPVISDTSESKGTPVGGGWVVNAKDGSSLHDGFVSKKEASQWASLEVEHKRLKAGQYKIKKMS